MLKRALIIVFDLILVIIFTPVVGRIIVLFSAPFIFSLLLLIKFTPRITVYIGTFLCLILGLLWAISYISQGSGLLGLIPGITTFVVGMAGILVAISVNRFIH